MFGREVLYHYCVDYRADDVKRLASGVVSRKRRIKSTKDHEEMREDLIEFLRGYENAEITCLVITSMGRL